MDLTDASSPHRVLIVCHGGPMAGWWFYAEDFTARQNAAQAVQVAGRRRCR